MWLIIYLGNKNSAIGGKICNEFIFPFLEGAVGRWNEKNSFFCWYSIDGSEWKYAQPEWKATVSHRNRKSVYFSWLPGKTPESSKGSTAPNLANHLHFVFALLCLSPVLKLDLTNHHEYFPVPLNIPP